MRVAVTGATGNLGTSVLAALAEMAEVESVVGIARRRPGSAIPGVEWATADVAVDDLAPALEGADAVIHLAWAIQPSRDERRLEDVNVRGTERVLEAAAACGAKSLVHASSVGAYTGVEPARRGTRFGESHATTGIPTSTYSSQKATVERMLDSFERAHPEVAVARMRPALIFKREAAAEIRRLFAGPFLPNGLLRWVRPPILPVPAGLRFQVVHADDAGQGFALAAAAGARGPFNLAAEPVLEGADLARALGARAVPVRPAVLRTLANATWRARLQPTPAGWLDMAMASPLMDTSRARDELGWEPRAGARETLTELIEGLAAGAGGSTPPLHPRAGGRFRLGELRSRIGGSS